MKNEIILFKNQNIKLEVNLKDETVWLNSNQMAKLFDRDVKTIRKHINNALKEELNDEVVIAKFASTFKHGSIEDKIQTKMVNYYNLDVIISVAATLFIYFLEFYNILYKNNTKIIDNNTLVALTILIAQSSPKEKDVLIDLVMNFIISK